jgi:hypothetical protein
MLVIKIWMWCCLIPITRKIHQVIKTYVIEDRISQLSLSERKSLVSKIAFRSTIAFDKTLFSEPYINNLYINWYAGLYAREKN